MKKMIFVLLTMVLVLTGCSSEEEFEYTISFETNGGSEIESYTVGLEDLIEEPTEPVKHGYIFSGWYGDDAFTNLYVFNGTVYGDLELHVKWVAEFEYSEYMRANNPVITIVVENVGVMELELFPNVAPNTVDNFIMYIQAGDFTGNSFHRVIEDFMIQGGNTYSTTCPITGDFSSNGVVNDLEHFRGVISMARTSVNNSATSQFFIVHEDSNFLDGNYATFGGLISGLSVLDFIATVDTNSSDAPTSLVVIESITIELNGYVPGTPVCAN